jgi:hypothetical protein
MRWDQIPFPRSIPATFFQEETMRRLILMGAILTLALAGAAQAEIGWAGNVWPNSGASVTPTGPVAVYAQVWKGGVTDSPGQGAGIAATMALANSLGAVQDIAMGYLGDVGSNDEYTAQIPASMLMGAAWVQVAITFHDLDDGTDYGPVSDQAGNPAPQQYSVVDVTPVDIDVTFTVCLSGAATAGDVCVIGSAPEIGSWGTGVNLTQVDGDLYAGTVTFAAGSNPSFEYKYKKDGCASWEGAPNRHVILPTDGTAAVSLEPDSWDNLPMGCGLGNVLEHQVVVCLQVCMDGVDNTGAVCVTGNQDALTNWGGGLLMTEIGANLYQACITFEAGQPVPVTTEYKFRKDGCETWESVANRVVVVDQASPAQITETHTFDDGPGTCEPVATENETWSVIKGLFR